MTDETSHESAEREIAKEEKPAKRYRLKTRAQMHGAVREPGYVFTLKDGELGPHRTVVASNHGAQITDHMNAQQDLVDQPLYEEIKEAEENPPTDKPLFDISQTDTKKD